MDHKLYLSDPGIYRLGDKFYYHKNKQQVDSKTYQRVSRFVVPPAWRNVWYASRERCHIQVCGIDQSGKKQYILSEKWIQNSKFQKFNRMKQFIRDLGKFKRKIKLTGITINRETLICLLFNLLIDLHIRVGNEIYAEQNGSYGLTTLRQKHLKLKNGVFSLQFVGKSGISHTVVVPSEYNRWFQLLIVTNPTKPLFHYKNGSEHFSVSSEELNDYLKRHMGKEYTCKDFRTYSANMLFIKSFLKNSKSSKQNSSKQIKPKKIVLNSIDESARQLGHSRNISRKSYISENLIDYCVDSFSTAALLSPSELLGKV
jgi:DNA topoisomerase-1